MDRTYIDEDCEHIRKKRRIDRIDFFEDLPDELLERILVLTCKAKEARFVCRKWRGIVSDNSFLRTLCLQLWGEDTTPIKYERALPENRVNILNKYFIPRVKDENNDDKVDWNRYYKIRSNYEKLLSLERTKLSEKKRPINRPTSKLSRKRLKISIGAIHMGQFHKNPEVSYRALKLLCDLARIYIEEDNISATDYFIVQTWSDDNEPLTAKFAKYNTKICLCLVEFYEFVKNKGITKFQVSLMQKITNRFMLSSLDPNILVAIMKDLCSSEPILLHNMQVWYAKQIQGVMDNASDKPSISNEIFAKNNDVLYEATKRWFNASQDFSEKLRAIDTGMQLANRIQEPEVLKKIYRLVADLARENEKFEEQSLMLLAKMIREFKTSSYVDGYKFLIDVALRRRKILLADPIQQFYIASSLLDTLDDYRVQFFNEDELSVLHQALLSHNLQDIQANDLTKHQIRLIPKLLIFGSLITPYLPQYDRFLFEGQSHNPKLAVFYLCNVLLQLQPDKAIRKITSLIEQRTHPSLGSIIAEGYDRFKAILGDLWTIKYDEIVIEVLLELFSEKTKEVKLKEPKAINKKEVKGKWMFPIKDVDELVLPWAWSTPEQDKAILLLMKYAKNHPMSRSVQIQILNIALCLPHHYSLSKEFVEVFNSMPIIHSEDITDIVPQLFETIDRHEYDSTILLRLVNLHPCAVLIRFRRRKISDMNSICNMAIIGSHYGMLILDAREWKEAQLTKIKQKLSENESQLSPKLKKVLQHYAIQLICSQYDTRTTSYSAYRENDYWSVMKSTLKRPEVREKVLQFIDDYNTETNFMRELIPKYKQKK